MSSTREYFEVGTFIVVASKEPSAPIAYDKIVDVEHTDGKIIHTISRYSGDGTVMHTTKADTESIKEALDTGGLVEVVETEEEAKARAEEVIEQDQTLDKRAFGF